MLDVGCGPGNLAIGFASMIGSVTAVDIEPDMLRLARAAAVEAGAHIAFVEAKVEDLSLPADSIDFVTIGRALHWLSPPETLAVLERIVAPGGWIAVCRPSATEAPVNAWNEKFKAIRRAWSPDPDETRYRPDVDKWFGPSRFRKVDEISVVHRQKVTIEDLVRRGLSFSITSPSVLGERKPEFEAAIEEALTPFAKDGAIEEELAAKATVFQ